ncbi:MAG: DNA repair protein RecO [Candidatus Celerinatantimonas neptuna]|nr:MAG: DNA repair protein RecO [Candidatus Celerinatantimonas neptuna]
MELTPAFVLHRRPYRENSALIQLFSWRYGRLSAVARLSKGRVGLLQPFTPLQLGLTGRSALKTIARLESQSLSIPLFGDALYSGFYMNELLYYLLPESDVYPLLYQTYQQALIELADTEVSLAATLRQFELTLLSQLGYGLPTSTDIHPDLRYIFVPGQGFVVTDVQGQGYVGAMLQSLSHFDRCDTKQLKCAKKLCREQLDELLAGRVLHSRELLVRHRAIQRED